ncbi:hypothetical protein ITJ55_05875 [Frigoribacterium sp. VKM Ac-1396]|uniref:hypothetical protein n=1 Tax=Frigoribacterium sp. VKM Ac-1396 TaxID=2783821 RepID=UPI00188C9FAE|nr:hypothetical protein [Frigoribacterium sp. VKM Ac-1396]MBF4600330.1 hypothetical protein [Frigoribacterium sp. VKM Ac-1396]
MRLLRAVWASAVLAPAVRRRAVLAPAVRPRAVRLRFGVLAVRAPLLRTVRVRAHAVLTPAVLTPYY